MATFAAPSPRKLAARADAFAALVRSAVDRTLRDTADRFEVMPTVDDVGYITDRWLQLVDEELLPKVATTWHGSAEQITRAINDGLARRRGLRAMAYDESGHGFAPAPPEELATIYLATARNRLRNVGDVIWHHARRELVDGIQSGESIPKLRDRIAATAGLAYPRAEVIARTEVISAANQGSLASMKTAGLEATKTWVATMDDRTRPTHIIADGQTVGLSEFFVVGGTYLTVPGDPAGKA